LGHEHNQSVHTLELQILKTTLSRPPTESSINSRSKPVAYTLGKHLSGQGTEVETPANLRLPHVTHTCAHMLKPFFLATKSCTKAQHLQLVIERKTGEMQDRQLK